MCSTEERAAAALKAGNSVLASELYSQLLRDKGPPNAHILFNRSLAFCQQGLHKQAIDDLQKVTCMLLLMKQLYTSKATWTTSEQFDGFDSMV